MATLMENFRHVVRWGSDLAPSPEEKSVLETVFHVLESTTVYIASVAPVADELDKRMLEGLLELADLSVKRLPEYFPEVTPPAEERKKRGGAQ